MFLLALFDAVLRGKIRGMFVDEIRLGINPGIMPPQCNLLPLNRSDGHNSESRFRARAGERCTCSVHEFGPSLLQWGPLRGRTSLGGII